MRIYGEFVSDKSVTMGGIGYLRKDVPLIIDEFRLVRIEARYGCPVGHLNLPLGVAFTLIIETGEE